MLAGELSLRRGHCDPVDVGLGPLDHRSRHSGRWHVFSPVVQTDCNVGPSQPTIFLGEILPFVTQADSPGVLCIVRAPEEDTSKAPPVVPLPISYNQMSAD